MSAINLQKRATLLLLFVGLAIIGLTSIPFVEEWLQTSVFPGFGIEFQGGWSLSGSTTTTAMDQTIAFAIETFFRILKIFLWMSLVISLVRLFVLFGMRALYRNSTQSEVSSILKTVLSVVIYIIAFFIIFQSQYPDIPLSPLFTGSTILGIVVGLALQDTLGNLFAGIAIQADQPFQVGDVISITNNGKGVVESVSWRGVKIRTFQNRFLVISNSVLGKETIEVAPKHNLNARLVFFNTLYTNSPAKTANQVLEAIRHVDNLTTKFKPVVRIRNLGDNGIDWEVKYWLKDYALHNDTDAEIRQRIWYVFQRENIDFAYPTRTIYMESKPETTGLDEVVNKRVSRLNRVRIFAPLSHEETEKLASASTSRIFAAGESIVRMGQEGDSMFVIVRGGVRIQVPEKRGMKTLTELKENSFFGEMSLLTGQPRSANVVAIEETEVLQISKNAMKPIFENNPELVQSIYDIIGERQEVLESISSDKESSNEMKKVGVVRSIKQFFGLRS